MIIRNLLLVILIMITFDAQAYMVSFANKLELAPEEDIARLKNFAYEIKNDNIENKIIKFSSYFMNKPYNAALGDWLISWDLIQTDKDKKQLLLINLENADCISFIELVLALSTMKLPVDDSYFKTLLANRLRELMFSPGNLDYFHRNHFFDVDWITNNQKLIGKNLFADLPYSKIKSARINKQDFWQNQLNSYATKYIAVQDQKEFFAHFRLNPNNQFANDNLVMNKNGMFFDTISSHTLNNINPNIQISKISYISFSDYINHRSEIDALLDKKIYIFAMLVDQPKLLELTGSEHNIAHIGFLIQENNQLFVRHSSSIGPKAVTDISLIEYAKSKEKSKIFPGFVLYELNL